MGVNENVEGIKKNENWHFSKRNISTTDIQFHFPPNIYLFKFSNRNNGKRCEICSKLTIKTPKRVRLTILWDWHWKGWIQELIYWILWSLIADFKLRKYAEFFSWIAYRPSCSVLLGEWLRLYWIVYLLPLSAYNSIPFFFGIRKLDMSLE